MKKIELKIKNEKIQDILDVRRHVKNKDVLLIDYTRMPTVSWTDHGWYMDSIQTWTSDPAHVLYSQGYLRAEKWMSDLRYLGAKVYVRLNGFTLPANPNKITPNVLYNVYKNRSVARFIAGTTKVGYAPIDLKTLGVLIPVAIGIAVGMLYFLR